MPAHIHAQHTTEDGHVVDCGTCNLCCLAVCDVCGAYEGSLTIDCPGSRVDYDTQTRVYKTGLDYSDALGWHDTGKPKDHSHHVNFQPREPRARTVILD